MIGWEKVKNAKLPSRFFSFEFLCLSSFYMEFKLCGSLKRGQLHWREKWCGCQSWCSLQLGALEWGLLAHLHIWHWFFFLHELTLKCFPGSFRVFLAWLSVSMQAGVYINAHMLFFHSTIPLSLPLSLSFPLLSGPTYLYPPLLSICGDCRVFSVDCHIHHLPLDIDVLVNVYFGPGR